MADRFRNNPTTFVGVPVPTSIYVGVGSREDFDKIALPCDDHGENEHGHVLVKHLRAGEIDVVFQHWVKSRTLDALYADFLAKKAI